jgi:hypothetical protein
MIRMSFRRRQQLHRAASRATLSPTARRHPPIPRRLRAREAHENPLGGVPQGGGAPPGQGLDWARRLELASVLIAALVSVAALWYTNNQVRQEVGVAKEGQVTDRYTAAVGNLGHDKADVRLGSIYALQRIMEDSPRDHPTIVNVLAAYVRTHAANPQKDDSSRLPADVEAALNVLAYRETRHDSDDFTLDLSEIVLAGAKLGDRVPHSGGVEIAHAELANAMLSGTDLRQADLSLADLSRARMAGANLRHANLSIANLQNADLSRADLRDSWMIGAVYVGANLDGADLRGARGVEVKHLLSAYITADTRLPVGIAKDPAIKERIARCQGEC